MLLEELPLGSLWRFGNAEIEWFNTKKAFLLATKHRRPVLGEISKVASRLSIAAVRR